MLAMKDDIDFVQSSLYGADLVAFTKQAKGYGFFDGLPFMAFYDIAVLRALGKDAPEGVYGFARGDFFADPNLKMMEFVEKYRAKYNGEYPSGWAVLGYDAIYALKAAIEKAGTTDTDAVREALKGMDFNGLRGYTPVRAIDLMMVVPTYNGIITHESPYPFPIWRDIWRIDGAEVIRSEESVLEVRAALREPKLKVAVLHIDPIGDYGWTYKAHSGAQAMAEALPYVELSEKEEACGPDTPQIMREYADTGYKVIFCHARDFGEYIEQVAPNYLDVRFMWGNGVEKKAPNVGIYYGRMYEAKFLVGMVAGAMTKTNKIGYAAGIPITDVHNGTWDEHPGQDWWYELAEGGVKLAPFSDLVPEDVKEMVEEKKQAIIKGEFEVFPGMTDEELREIYYFEPNVVGDFL